MLSSPGFAPAALLATLRLVAAAVPTASLSPELSLLAIQSEPEIPNLEARNNKHHGHHTTQYSGLAAPTALWVGVGLEGTPTWTFTPKATTVDGKTRIDDAPPYEITGTAFTEYHPDRTVFATRMPQPTLEGQGAFPVCDKQKGEAGYPFCWPHPDLPLFAGSTYYLTWNPSTFNESKLLFQNETRLANGTLYTGNGTLTNTTLTIGNTTLTNTTHHLTNKTIHRTVRLLGTRVNQTDGEDDPLFETDEIPGTRGMHMLKITSKFIHYKYPTNLSLTLVSNFDGYTTTFHAPIMRMMYRPEHERETHIPQDAELYIALPIVFGFIILMSVGLLIYHRNTRHIGIGSIMGKAARAKRAERRRRKHDEETMDGDDIPLMEGHGSDVDGAAAPPKKRREPKRERPNPFKDYPSYLKMTQGAVVRNPNSFYEDLARQREEERRRLYVDPDDLPGPSKKME